MVLMLANLSDRYSGTRLFTVLNIKDFSCLARLSARLSHLRACRIGAELASQLDPVIMRAAPFWSFSSFCWDHYRYSLRQRCINRDAEESMTCKYWQGYSGDILVLASSGQLVLLQLYRWLRRCEPPTRVFHQPERLGVEGYVWIAREQRDFLPRACKQTFSLEDIKT